MARRVSLSLSIIILLVVITLVIIYLYGYRTTADINTIRHLSVSGNLGSLANHLDRSMELIPAGEFIMGSDEHHQDERPSHQVYLDEFELDRYEVTNVQYQRFVIAAGVNPPRYWYGESFPTGQAAFPVVGVSWVDAKAYCNWIGKRLPTEAEWEKACRGSEGRLYPWGSQWDLVKANVGFLQTENWPDSLEDGWQMLRVVRDEDELLSLRSVGSFPQGSSPYGVLDLVGNVSEWVADWYNWDGYWDLPLTNPIGLGPPWNHSIRGSGWFDRLGQEAQIADLSRCSARNSSHSYDDPRLGFRCAR